MIQTDVCDLTILRGLREKRNLTQKQLAEKAGLSKSFIYYLEKGKRDASRKTVLKLAKALDVPVSIFLKREVKV